MKIGIIGAIQKEIYQFKKMMKNRQKTIIGHCLVYTGQIYTFNIILIKSGVGKVSASIATMILIKMYQPKFIINSGSAGSLKSCVKIGDIIIPKNICYYDVDLVNFGYSFGQVPGLPKSFKNNLILYQIFKNTAQKIKCHFLKGNIISGDSFIRKKDTIQKLKLQFSSAIAVDMESAAIAQVCYQFYIPLIVIKYVSDASYHDATKNFKKNIYTASVSAFNLTKNMLDQLWQITALKKQNRKKKYINF